MYYLVLLSLTAPVPMTPVTHSAQYRSQTDAFTNLMKLWQINHAQQGKHHNYEELIQDNPALRSAISHSPCIIWVFAIHSGQYTFVSDNVKRILGYAADLFCSTDADFLNRQIHPDDMPRVDTLRKIRNEWMQSLPSLTHDAGKFNCDYRFRRADGIYAWLFEQNTILHTNYQGRVTHLLGVVSDITDWKKNDSTEAITLDTSPITHQLPITDRPAVQLSKRECEVVQLMAKGHTSKTIAELLGLSFHTVNTHRRNIIKRTQTQTTGGLVQYAMCNGLI
jgi:PAS domain S-box-containing protein